MSYQTLKLEMPGAVATITLNRPEKRNAISHEMIEDLLNALAEVEQNGARVLIFTGVGKAFCSGMDLDELKDVATQTPENNVHDARHLATLYRRLWTYSKPTIAAVNGAAIAGGCGLATLCDFTISAPQATFGYPEVRIGFIPAIVSVFLARQIGEKHARDLLLTGRIIDAVQAQHLGLVTKIVPTEELKDEAQALAVMLLACSPESLRQTKRLLCELSAPDLDSELESAVTASAEIRFSPDFQEGLASFLEKRPPRWSSS